MDTTLAERFWAKVIKTDACWLWNGAINNMGYGMINIGNRHAKTAHRISWLLNIGEIPPGMCVLHHCDNPKCVNPNHLFLGTQKENAIDREQKGRSPLGEQRPNAKLSNNDVIEIKKLIINGKLSLRAISRKYNVCLATIRQIVTGRTWSHVEP